MKGGGGAKVFVVAGMWEVCNLKDLLTQLQAKPPRIPCSKSLLTSQSRSGKSEKDLFKRYGIIYL